MNTTWIQGCAARCSTDIHSEGHSFYCALPLSEKSTPTFRVLIWIRHRGFEWKQELFSAYVIKGRWSCHFIQPSPYRMQTGSLVTYTKAHSSTYTICQVYKVICSENTQNHPSNSHLWHDGTSDNQEGLHRCPCGLTNHDVQSSTH